MTQSRFVKLSSYCIAEYMSEPLGSTNFLSEDFILLENSTSDLNQILNTDASYSSTKNIQDLTVVPIGTNKFAYADSEKTPNYLDYDDNITQTSITGYNVIYDRVRFHFIAGFTLGGLEALILSVRNLQNNGKSNLFSNILVAPETISELVTFNSKPLFISSSTYDRYIDILVPSIKNINEDYKTALSQSTTFAANITPTEDGYSGFIYNNQIYINLSECNKRDKLNSESGVKYDIFEVSENYESPVSQTNEFDDVGTYVGESSSGDFIEYYLTFNSGFPEELISILNRRNPSNDWIIIHQISVFEQIGSSFVNTSRFVNFQEDNFDEPLLYRPILKNAGQAVSMSIDIISRLTNRLNGEQIIREASFTSLSPKKYGKKLNVIPLSDEPQSQKVYNKIVKKNFEATNLFIEPTFAPGFDNSDDANGTLSRSIEYVPIFFSNNNISISNISGRVTKSDDSEEVIFKPGQMRFVITPFDNSIKIKIYNVIKDKAVPLDLNINGSNFQMVFNLDTGKLPIRNKNSDTEENLSTGELMFNISKENSEKILASNDRTFYITSISQDGSESLLYSGEWRKSSEQSDVDSAVGEAKEEADYIATTEAKIRELEQQIRILRKTNIALQRGSRFSTFSKKGKPSIVNKIGLRNPKGVRTDIGKTK